MLRRLRTYLRSKRRGVTYGLRRFDLPLLASYSRSGTNWIRYFIEYVGGRPTPGQTRLVEGQDYCIDRAHCAYPIMHSYGQVILVIRDYRECIVRHYRRIWPEYPSAQALLTDDALKHPVSWYIRNIEAFDSFRGKKLLIYYEDLIAKPAEAFAALAGFLSLDAGKTRQFLGDLDSHFQASVRAYTREGNISESSSSQDVGFHARTKLTPEQMKEFDDFYFLRYPYLANKYLSHYRQRPG